jgi:hypothetical protein
MSGAIFSHIAVGNGVSELFPSLLLLILTVVSWYFRPSEKKVTNASKGELKEQSRRYGLQV